MLWLVQLFVWLKRLDFRSTNSGAYSKLVGLQMLESLQHRKLELAELASSAAAYAKAARAPNTLKAYRSDWQAFAAWCQARSVVALPTSGDLVALYLTELAQRGLKASTLARKLSAISQQHVRNDQPSPRTSAALATVWQGIKRTLGTLPAQKEPLLVEHLRRVSEMCGESRAGIRDRALIVFGFASGMRRAELVALELEHVRRVRDGFEVLITRSKRDQEATGRVIGVPYGSTPATCPVRCLNAWLELAGVERGALFRSINRAGCVGERLSGQSVALIIKAAVLRAGFDANDFAGHSLRAGFVTSAARAGKSERAIMDHTGHKSTLSVRRYIRRGTLFADNPAAGIGL